MRYVYAAIMLAFSVIALFYATRVFYNRNYKKATYRVFSLLSLASGIWSLGYGMMFLQDDTKWFAIYRGIGIVGIITYMIVGQVMLCVIAGTMKKLYTVIWMESLVGIVVFLQVIDPKNVIMEATENGIVTTFTTTLLSVVYTVYCVAIAISFVWISLDMIKKKNSQRNRAFGRSFLKGEVLIGVGMVIDTLLPAFGINPNIPASTIFQFIGLEIVYRAIHKINRNMLNVENMVAYIYRSLKVPVLVFDDKHVLQMFNKQAKTLFDFPAEKIGKANRFWEAEFGLENPKDVDKLEETLVIDAIFPKKKMNCRLSVDPILDEYKDYLGYIVVITDMTANVKAMQAVEQAKNDAEMANKSKSIFLANMSHEIRTPMNSILGFSQLALRQDIDDISREYFLDIKSSAEMLLSTINGILDISKVESGRMELDETEYSTIEVIKEIATVIQMQAMKKDLLFTMNLDREIPAVLYGDKTRVREILINLLNNGIKYTQKGAIHLEGKVVLKQNDYVRLQFAISDTGTGIKEEDLPTIFESFKRVDKEANRQTEGTGLGLSITKALVELMGGEIRVESEYGKGSVFTIEIVQKIKDDSPFTEKKLEKTSKKVENKLLLQNKEVLAVDDNPVNLKVASAAVRMLGGKVDTALNGMDAISCCEKKQYDVILLDYMMPEMDGVETMQRIRALGNGYEKDGTNKIIVLTANALNGVREEMIRAGFDEFLGKPIDMEIFGDLLEKLLP